MFVNAYETKKKKEYLTRRSIVKDSINVNGDKITKRNEEEEEKIIINKTEEKKNVICTRVISQIRRFFFK